MEIGKLYKLGLCPVLAHRACCMVNIGKHSPAHHCARGFLLINNNTFNSGGSKFQKQGLEPFLKWLSHPCSVTPSPGSLRSLHTLEEDESKGLVLTASTMQNQT